MFDVPFAFAFGAGMVATVNPCGFAMLPAYLGFFVGTETAPRGFTGQLRRSLTVSIVMTAGFVVVFGVVGLLVQTVASSIDDHLSKVTVGIGIVLVLLGLWLLTGHQIRGLGVRLDRGGRDRSLLSMFVYGISYAVASLSCTLGPFLVALTPTFRGSGAAAGITAYFAYALGMGTIVTLVTVMVGLAEQSVVDRVRRAAPWVNRIAGALLVLAGIYVTRYGLWQLDGSFGADPIIDGASRIQSWLAERVDALPKVLLALVAAGLVMAVAGGTAVRRARHQPGSPLPSHPSDEPCLNSPEPVEETTPS